MGVPDMDLRCWSWMVDGGVVGNLRGELYYAATGETVHWPNEESLGNTNLEPLNTGRKPSVDVLHAVPTYAVSLPGKSFLQFSNHLSASLRLLLTYSATKSAIAFSPEIKAGRTTSRDIPCRQIL
jgi:hypothetical protein